MSIRAFTTCLAAALFAAGPVAAATYTYSYFGTPFTVYEDYSDPAEEADYSYFLGERYTATFTIDEDLLGYSLANAELHVVMPPNQLGVTISGITQFDVTLSAYETFDLRGTVAGAEFYALFDGHRNIIEAWADFANGPPDGAFGNGGSYIRMGDTYLRAESGDAYWLLGEGPRVAQAPIPAALPMMLVALGGLGMLAYRRRRASLIA